MEPWPSFIFMLRAHTGLLSSTSVFHCSTSSRASKGPLRCRRWTLEAFPITCQYVGYADIRQPLGATVRTHMFHPRPLQQTVPQYVGLDARLTCMRFRPARSFTVPFVFSSEAPCQASSRPLPSGPQVEQVELVELQMPKIL